MAETSFKPIFAKPYGANEGPHSFCHSATSEPVFCELCGTVWKKPSPNDSRPWGHFLGRQYVDECCGKFIQQIFDAFGGAFAQAFLSDFSQRPMDSQFGLLRFMLPGVLRQAAAKIEAVSADIKLAQASLAVATSK